ncbi:DNA gyrase [Agrobacterium sp. SHOUNA12C]|uniref:DNA gyrase n=1 Tax=Rhizobium rhizogenes NBRC 13257 TaxID=1220581 RepID=A0AA87Q8S7_RHIRH|nr:Pnap_2097 family protein [Rhizobium rhizogenes]MCJ9722508.1 DNA gyrase [Agrobacterium sp. BETTINA12B]MCJ9758331.1 DNA gyrase [Agrobacterium sp. SHOUNA12C]NTF51290.1 DNA gyrase [Rhizobium rhizogenes]NTF57824.1 DNA gyrase [Rhizobium rhizogenes]NTF64243.1 DNA gyrase [Rhizobium rhizogenes]
MSLAICNVEMFHQPSKCVLMERALEPHILLGMPQLTPFGLSETWLMKELGHRHWLLLARRMGMDDADFRTADGTETYAAICATSLTNAQLDRARANQVLCIQSVLEPVSKTQVASRHRLLVDGEPIGDVELLSAFVRRTRENDNVSIARVELPGTHCFPVRLENTLARIASDVRNGRCETHLGMAVADRNVLRDFRFQPATTQEFNGAGLLYFAHFQAFVARALESWFPDGAFRNITQRDSFFLGNAGIGEPLSVELTAMDRRTMSVACNLRRSDGDLIGRVFLTAAH